MKKKKILFILSLICLAFFLNEQYKSHSRTCFRKMHPEIEQALAELSKREIVALETLFWHLFYLEQFAYPLFGTKPMSIAYLPPELENGWEAWEKVSLHFQSNRFVIGKYDRKGHTFLCIGNLEQIEKTYTKNKDLFRDYSDFSELRQAIRMDFSTLIENDLILGMLLGYGRTNAELFVQKAELKPFSQAHPIFYYFSGVTPCGFACDPNSEETIELKERYENERRNIVHIGRFEGLFNKMLVLLNNSS